MDPHASEVALGLAWFKPRRAARWRGGLILALGLLATLLPAWNFARALPDRSLPGLGGGDPRRRVDSSQPPWRAVARLQVPGVSRCTATVVAPALAVTAAHCLWSRASGRWVPAGSVHVLPGYAFGGFAAHLLASGYRIAPGYDPTDPDATRGADFAVVSLSTPTPDALPLARLPVAPGTAAALGGYNQDRGEVIEADLDCRVTGVGADRRGHKLLLHNCSATRGTSGGPLLVRDASGTLVLAGIQVGALVGRPGGVAVPASVLQGALPLERGNIPGQSLSSPQ
jgi:protease YdgD